MEGEVEYEQYHRKYDLQLDLLVTQRSVFLRTLAHQRQVAEDPDLLDPHYDPDEEQVQQQV